MQTHLCIADLEMLFCDMKTLRLTNDLVTKDFPASHTCTAALQNLKNTCYFNHALFQ